MAKHRSFKRILHRVTEELHATQKIADVTSWKDAWITFLAKVDIQVMNRNGFCETPGVRKRLLKKHEVMLDYFEKTFGDFISQYDFDRKIPEDNPELHDRIWICWWQGLENAPVLVQKCVESIQNHAGLHKVTIITEENYKQYVDIPVWIERKYKQGIITRTNYSDLLRLSLLAEHGGLWLDATFFCRQLDVETCFANSLWSIKRPDYLHASVAGGYFAGYSLACRYESRWIFVTIRDFFLQYWKTNDMLIDYLLVDYMIVLAQRKDFRIAAEFAKIPPNNPKCDDLCIALGKPFDQQLWEDMVEDTSLFKLTWKQSFPYMKNGEETFYGKMMNNTL